MSEPNDFNIEEYRVDGATGLRLTAAKVASRRGRYVPQFPLRVLIAVRKAKATLALPIILVIHRQLRMSGKTETALGPAIWEALGNPSKTEKAAIFRNLKRVPKVICLNSRKRHRFHNLQWMCEARYCGTGLGSTIKTI